MVRRWPYHATVMKAFEAKRRPAVRKSTARGTDEVVMWKKIVWSER
jgi:hypothetical protein